MATLSDDVQETEHHIPPGRNFLEQTLESYTERELLPTGPREMAPPCEHRE